MGRYSRMMIELLTSYRTRTKAYMRDYGLAFENIQKDTAGG